MKFQVTPDHIKKQSRKSALVALMFAVFSVGCIDKLVRIQSLPDAVFPLIGLALFVPAIARTVKTIRDGALSYPSIDFDEPAGTMAVRHKDLVVTVDVKNIKKPKVTDQI